MELVARIQEFAGQQPERIAVVAGAGAGRHTLSYGQLAEGARNLAHALRENESEGLVFLAGARGGPLVVGLLGCLWAGVPCALVDVQQPPGRTAAILAQVPAPVVLADAVGVRHLARVNAGRPARVLSLLEFTLSGASGAISALPSAEKRAAVVLFTSGSTGQPKGVLIDRSDLDRRLAAEQEWFRLGAADRILGVLPLTFDVGLTQLLGTLFAGGTHVLGESWLPVDIVTRIEEDALTGLALAPVVWQHLLHAKQQEQVWQALNRLRYVTLSGGSLPRADLETIRDGLTAARFVRTYGQTEMFRIAALDVERHPEKLDSVGPAYPGVRLEVRRADGSLAGAGELGEVFAGGLGRMLGYWGDGQAVDPKQGELQATADFGYLDEDGFLYLRGRKDDMIKVLDRRVFPAEIANLCRAALGDSSIEVIAVSRPEAVVVAFTTNPLPAADVAGKLATLRREVGTFAPRQLHFLARMPATATGKVDYAALRAHALAALEADDVSGGNDGR